MVKVPPSTTIIAEKYRFPLLLALITAGLAGNYFQFPIFLDIYFIFGSIFALLALQFFGLGRGIAAAAIIAGYTYFSWNNPYSIITMTAEVFVVGWLMEHRKTGLVLADTLFWLLVGMPLAYQFCHVFIHAPLSTTYIIMTKQALNGIANALVARLIFIGYAHGSRVFLISYREIVYNLLAFFVLCPALIILSVESRNDFTVTDHHLRSELIQDSRSVDQRLETWVENRKSAVVNLANMAASLTPQQVQPFLEMTRKSDTNFQRVGLVDREATIIAFYPQFDEHGEKSIGKNIADRPYIQQIKRTLKPMLSEIVMGRIGTPKPIVLLLAPVIIRGGYGGNVIASLSLEQIRDHLDKSTDHKDTLYTLIDKNGTVIMTNRSDQAVMSPFVRGKGSLTRLDASISQWVPAVNLNTPFFERWKKSYYVAEAVVGSLAEWKLILEQPVAPFQKILYDSYTGKLTRLLLILLVSLLVAEFVSRKVVITLAQLRKLTYELPVRLATDGAGIEWPESGIKEANHLINNFRDMANTLSKQIAETRKITEEMRESRQQLLDIIDFFPDATFVVNNDKKVIIWNSAMEKMSGISKEDMLGKGDNAYTIPFYGVWRHSLLDLLDADNENLAFEYNDVVMENTILHAEAFCPALFGGKGAYVWASVASLYNTKGERVGAIESIRDTTERRQSQEALKQAYTEMEMRVSQRTAELDATNSALTAEIAKHKQAGIALRKSEALYHSLVETSQDLIWQCDAERRYTYLNLAWEQTFGYELDEMLGKTFCDFQPPEYAERDVLKFNALMQGEVIDRYETTYRGKFGNEIHLVFNALFVTNENGDIVGASGTAYDITQRKLMEEELLEAKVAAESANITKSRFLATMSHEIRTPMNGVIGMIELLQHTDLTQEQLEYANSAKNSGIRLVHLLNDILDLSKIEADRIELETSDFSLHTLISDTLTLLALQARDKGVKLSSTIDPEVPTALRGDAGRLRQIIINLIGNAIKFTAKGIVTLQIRKDCEDEHSVTLRFIVCDSGIGIPADKLEHIFEPFTQADSSTTRKYGGTGLGLPICKRLAELMGGSIGAESAESAGSTFWFTVAMRKQTETSLQDGRKVGGGRSSIPHLSTSYERRVEPTCLLHEGHGATPIRILLTEDDPSAQKIVPKLLKSYGYIVDVAGDGKEAVQALENNDYALVLMDCMMPEMNGYEVTAIIRNPASAVRRHDIPVIALTGNAMRQDRDICIAAGMDDHLSKPLLLPDLLAKLEKWLT